jgi:hypothetical protein
MKENDADPSSFNQDPFTDLAKAFYFKKLQIFNLKFLMKTAFNFSFKFMKHCKASGEHIPVAFQNIIFFLFFLGGHPYPQRRKCRSVTKREKK